MDLNFKYIMTDWEVQTIVLKGEDISPPAFILQKISREQAVPKQSFHDVVDMMTVYLCQPLSITVVERGARSFKRIKTRLRNSLESDKLCTLLHISINGPERRLNECHEMLGYAPRHP